MFHEYYIGKLRCIINPPAPHVVSIIIDESGEFILIVSIICKRLDKKHISLHRIKAFIKKSQLTELCLKI